MNPPRLFLSGGFLFVLSVFLTAYSSSHPWIARVGVHTVGEVMRPLQYVVRTVTLEISDLWTQYAWLVETEQANILLRERLAALEEDNSRLLERESEVEQLRKLVGAAQEHGLQGIAADVIGHDSSNWVRSITVDKGSLHGVVPGLAVIEGDAVVGQVTGVSPHTSRVLLISDHASAVDSLVQTSRVRGTVQGVGKGQCELRYVLQEDEIEVGDRLISSGMDKIFPKGITVGVVAEVSRAGQGMFKRIQVKPAADLARLETVLIVLSGANPILTEDAG